MIRLILILTLSFFLIPAFSQSEMHKFIDVVDYCSEPELNKITQVQQKAISNSEEKKLIIQTKRSEFQHNQLARIEALMILADETSSFDNYTKAWANYHLASTITSFDLASEGQLYTQKAIYFAKLVKDEKIMFYSYQNLAGSYYRLNDFKKAYSIYAECLSFKKILAEFQIASTYNNMGLCKFQLKHYKSALQEYTKGLSYVKHLNDHNSIDVYYLILGNRGSLYHSMGNYKLASKDLDQEYNYHVINKMYDLNFVSCLSELYELNTKNKSTEENYFEAFKNFIKRDLSITDKNWCLKTFVNRNEQFMSDSQRQYLLTIAFKTSQQYDSLIRKNQGDILSLLYNDKIKGLNAAKIQMEKEVKLEAKNNTFKTILILVLSVLFLISVIFIWKINQQKVTERKQAHLIQNQQTELYKTKQQLLENDLNRKQEELTLLNLNLRIKKETEENYLALIRKFKRSSKITVDEVINELQLNIKNLNEIDRKMDISTKIKSESNSEFNQMLKQKFPDLSENELVYCHYFLLNLSSKEIGQITGQTPGAVRVYKNKIKNKIGLNKENDLYDFLNSITIKN